MFDNIFKLNENKHISVDECNVNSLTTLRIGGRAVIVSPQNLDAFIYCLRTFRLDDQYSHIMGNGSNLLVNDSQLETPIIHTKSLKKIRFSAPYVEVEAGHMMPKLVNEACRNNLGGIEYLASVPGTIGGGVCMNAGRGEYYDESIHQRVVSVRVFDGLRERYIKQNELKSSYRWSLFREETNMSVLSVILKLEPMESKTVRKRILERMRIARNREDHSAPNAGSVFRIHKNYHRLQGTLNAGKASFSNKTCNWILNRGSTFKEIVELIQSVGSMDELEWAVWSR